MKSGLNSRLDKLENAANAGDDEPRYVWAPHVPVPPGAPLRWHNEAGELCVRLTWPDDDPDELELEVA